MGRVSGLVERMALLVDIPLEEMGQFSLPVGVGMTEDLLSRNYGFGWSIMWHIPLTIDIGFLFSYPS